MNPRVMYIELKEDGVRGPARIGRVSFSRTGKTLHYSGRVLAPLKGHGLKANYFDMETLEEFWISGPRADGRDSLHGPRVDIDQDCLEEYWLGIRREPRRASCASYNSPVKSKRGRDSLEKAARRSSMDRRNQPARYEPRRFAKTEDVAGGGEGEVDE